MINLNQIFIRMTKMTLFFRLQYFKKTSNGSGVFMIGMEDAFIISLL